MLELGSVQDARLSGFLGPSSGPPDSPSLRGSKDKRERRRTAQALSALAGVHNCVSDLFKRGVEQAIPRPEKVRVPGLGRPLALDAQTGLIPKSGVLEKTTSHGRVQGQAAGLDGIDAGDGGRS